MGTKLNSFREALAPLAARFPAAVREHEVLRVSASLPAGAESIAEARKQVLKWAARRCGGTLPADAWNFDAFEYLAGGRNSMAVRIQTDAADLWAIRAEDPDKVVPGRVWTTEVVIGSTGSEGAKFGARLLANTPEEKLDIEPHTPGFVQQVADNCGLFLGRYRAGSEPIIVEGANDLDPFIEMLVDADRKFPVFAISSERHDGGVAIDADALVKAVLGLGHVFILKPDASWALTRRLGKARSTYSGAIRIYMPGFSDDASPYSHRLILKEAMRTSNDTKAVVKELRAQAARESLLRSKLGQEVLTFNAVRQASLQISRKNLAKAHAPETDLLALAQELIDAQESQIEDLQRSLKFFSDEQASAEERAKAAEQLVVSANYRIQHLTTQLESGGTKIDADIKLPTTWSEFAEWCDNNLVGRLVLTSRARRQVRDPEYEDVETAAKSLLWLAGECRDRRMAGGDGTLGEVQILDAVRNAHCGGDAFAIDWQGFRHTADWHIKSGGNSHDPKRCLRIYYFWDEATQQIVVAEMPAHRRTDAT